jgi:hypothetical protein
VSPNSLIPPQSASGGRLRRNGGSRGLKEGCETVSRGMSTQDHPESCQALLALSPTEKLSAVMAALQLQGLETDYYLFYDLSLVLLGLSSAFNFPLQYQQTLQYAVVALWFPCRLHCSPLPPLLEDEPISWPRLLRR